MENRPVPLLGVLISGRGSNLQALIGAITDGRLQASIGVVISNRAAAVGLNRAREAGLEAIVVERRPGQSRTGHDEEIAYELIRRHVDLVCLAGYMRRLGPEFCSRFPNRILNIHPSLLPAFPGLDAQRQALEHGVRISGATVHLVTPELDAGPIVRQEAVEVRDDDTVETLAARILDAEHRIYPAAVQRIGAGGWRIDGRRVVFEGPREPASRSRQD